MYDFNLWLIDYGGNLDPNAIMSFVDAHGNPMKYKPPLWGHKKLLNFDTYSQPALGGYLMFVGMGLVFLRSEEHTSELQSRGHLVCRLLLEKKKQRTSNKTCVRANSSINS